jgi:hypothetical protein
MNNTEEAKTAFNARAKAGMREHLRSKTWVEKVESIGRMNVADRLAKEAMRKALAGKAATDSRDEGASKPTSWRQEDSGAA